MPPITPTQYHPAAYVFWKWLIQENLFGDPEAFGGPEEWPICFSMLPDRSDLGDNGAGVFETKGVPEGRLMSGRVLTKQAAMVMVRGLEYLTAWRKLESAREYIQGKRMQVITIDSVQYTLENMSQQGTIQPMGTEQGGKRRSLFSLNFLITLKT